MCLQMTQQKAQRDFKAAMEMVTKLERELKDRCQYIDCLQWNGENHKEIIMKMEREQANDYQKYQWSMTRLKEGAKKQLEQMKMQLEEILE